MYRSIHFIADNDHREESMLESDEISCFSRSCPSSIWLVPAEVDTASIIPRNKDFDDDVKLRKRRESHNAVERRRRDHINEMIQKLNYLISGSESLPDDCSRSNKGEILARAVEYISDLKSQYELALERLRQHNLH